jgi:hypothetical protein
LFFQQKHKMEHSWVQKIGHKGWRTIMYCLFWQTKGFLEETELRTLHTPSLSAEKNREESVLLQVRWSKIPFGVLEFAQTWAAQQKDRINLVERRLRRRIVGKGVKKIT